MEILIIFVLIAGLLTGWVYLMRVELQSFLQRVAEANASSSRIPAHTQAHSSSRIVSVRHAAAMRPPPSAPDDDVRVERTAMDTDGGIPKWSIGA
ncbi:MAG: hypothetical protein WCI17_02960 [bacterium]